MNSHECILLNTTANNWVQYCWLHARTHIIQLIQISLINWSINWNWKCVLFWHTHQIRIQCSTEPTFCYCMCTNWCSCTSLTPMYIDKTSACQLVLWLMVDIVLKDLGRPAVLLLIDDYVVYIMSTCTTAWANLAKMHQTVKHDCHAIGSWCRSKFQVESVSQLHDHYNHNW